MSDRFSHRRASAFVTSGRFSNGRPFGTAKHPGKKHGHNQKPRNHMPPHDDILDRYFNPPATDR